FRSEAVIDRLAVAARGAQAVAAQPRELLRYRGLAQRQQVLELGHRFLALAQQVQDHQPALVRERLEQTRSLARVRGHAAEIGRRGPRLRGDGFEAHLRSPGRRADYSKAPR